MGANLCAIKHSEDNEISTKVKNNGQMILRMNNECMKVNKRYYFSYTKKEIIDCKIIVYDDVEFQDDIEFETGQYIPKMFIYGKLIVNVSRRRYIFLSTDMRPIYKIYYTNDGMNEAELNFDEYKLLHSEVNEDMRDVYIKIKSEHRINCIDRCVLSLYHLPREIVSIILLYM